MNIYTNKKTKKFIIVLVMLTLFSFCYPKNVNADLGTDLSKGVARVIWDLESGILKFLNNIFTNDEHKYGEYTQILPGGQTYKGISCYLTPENIIKGRFLLFDANIFRDLSGVDPNYYYDYGSSVQDGKIALRNTIAGWYYALRNLAAMALLSVLVYVGIRMVISTIAQDKAKYKIMFKDWLIALCLLILMHYIMISILNITSSVTDAMGTNGDGLSLLDDLVQDVTGILDFGSITKNGETLTVSDAWAKLLVIAGIIGYSFIFAVKYLKREFTIIFLILLGPVSCITYPIDKISDGKAQAFNKWFSEFLFQVIIQPFHLLLYIVLVGTAAQLAETNVLYVLICFAMIIPAEKFIKEMFGFKDKLGSPLGAFASGALASKAVSALTSSSGGGSKGENASSSTSEGGSLPPKTVNRDSLMGASSEKGDGAGKAVAAGAIGAESADKGTVSQKENPALGAGETPGESASDTDANQGGDDSIAELEAERAEMMNGGEEGGETDASTATAEPDSVAELEAERAGMKDGIVDDAVTAGAMVAATNAMEENNESVEPIDMQSLFDQNYEKNRAQQNAMDKLKGTVSKAKDKEKEIGKKLKDVREQRYIRKHGTATRGQRFGNALKKGSASAVRLAAAGAGAIAGGAASFMFGKGVAGGALAGAAIGKKVGNKAISGVRGTANFVKDYSSVFRKDEGLGREGRNRIGMSSKEQLAFNQFKSDPKQINRAMSNYRKNHEGKEPTRAELNQEMQDRFELSRYGLSEDQVDKAVGSYQELRDEKTKGLTDENQIAAADKAALNETAYATELAYNQGYQNKDFRNGKTMAEAMKTISASFQSNGVDAKTADVKAEKYLRQAASIRGTEIAIEKTIDVPPPSAKQVSGDLGIKESSLDQTQVERINKITVQLRQQGFSNKEISSVAASCKGGSTTEILDKYEAQLEYLDDGYAQDQAKATIEKRNDGEVATKEELQAEMKERLIIKTMFNIKNERQLTNLRQQEDEVLKSKSLVEQSRSFANKHRGYLNNGGHMAVAKQKLIKDLMKTTNCSSDKATKDANEIIKMAAEYNGESVADNA